MKIDCLWLTRCSACNITAYFFFAFFCSRFCFYYNFCFTSDIFFFLYFVVFFRSFFRVLIDVQAFVHMYTYLQYVYKILCIRVYVCYVVLLLLHSLLSFIDYLSFVPLFKMKKKQQNSHKILWFPMKRYLVPMNVAFYRRLPNEIESSKIITVTPYDESD